jgi:hypothetical protein
MVQLAIAQVYHPISLLQDHQGHHNCYYRIIATTAIILLVDMYCRLCYCRASKSTISRMFPFPYTYLALLVQYYCIPINRNEGKLKGIELC